MGNYKGINLTWRDAETGHLFELQFHTPDSFWINKGEHLFYEIKRLPDGDPGDTGEWGLTKAEANALSKEMWSHAALPDGADELALALGR
jgi:hypothetical protein